MYSFCRLTQSQRPTLDQAPLQATMENPILSKNGDKVFLGLDPVGVLVGVIPETPPKPDALDYFTLHIRFTNAARIAAMLERGGTYTAVRGGSTITTERGEYVIRMPFEHDPRSRFTVVLDRKNSEAFAAFFRDAVTGESHLQDEWAPPSPHTAVGRGARNTPCSCGSGKKYKRCCMTHDTEQRTGADPRRLPPELRPLAESHDPLCQAYVSDYLADPDLDHDPEFWHSAGCAISTHGQPFAALACLGIARRLAPSDQAIVLNLAVTMSGCGNHSEALELVNTVSHGTNRHAVIRANILQSLQRHDEAIGEYKQAILEEPEFYLPYARLLESLRETESPLYEHWLTRAVDALPRSPIIAQYFVRFCQHHKRFDELADAEWLESLEAGLGRVDVMGRGREEPAIITRCQVMHLAARALRDRSLGDLQRALQTLQALPEDWELCDAGRLIAEVAATLGDSEGATAGWSRICKHCKERRIGLPKSGLVGYQVTAHMNRGENEQAVTLCEQAGDSLAQDPLLLRCYWWAMDDLGRTSEAISAAERLVSLGEAESPLFYNLGYLCGKDGAFGKARYYYQKEVELAPTNLMAWENLAFVHLLASQMGDAKHCYGEYQRLRNEDLALCPLDDLPECSECGDETADADLGNEQSLIAAAHEHCDAKDRKFELLLLAASRSLGSISYAIDLIAENNSTSPIVGAFTTVKPVFLSPAQILANLAGGEACTEELQFHVASQQRADVSTVLAAIEQFFVGWREMPGNAQKSLIEAERIFRLESSVDFSSAIVSYAKTVEICLYDLIFKSFKDRSGADFRMEQHVKAVLADPQSKAIRLARFVETGHALELGSMTFLLQLCTGKTGQRIPLLAALRDHIVGSLAAPAVLGKDYLAAAELLASRFRNKAAHESTFDLDACREVRTIIYRLLNGLPECASHA